MADFTKVFFMKDNSVAANSTDTVESPIVPSEKTVTILEFGGSSKDGLIILQWGSGASWQTVRASHYHFRFDNFKIQFVGDGAKKFRLIRKNYELVDREMPAWMEAYYE